MGNIHMGTMAGKLNGRDAGDDAERLAHGPAVDAGADLLGEFAFEEVRDAGGELETSRPRVASPRASEKTLPCSRGDEGGDFVEAVLEEFAEAEEDAGAAEGRLRGPGGEGGGGGGDGGVDFGGGGERDAGLDVAGGGVVDVGETAGGAGRRGGRRSSGGAR